MNRFVHEHVVHEQLMSKVDLIQLVRQLDSLSDLVLVLENKRRVSRSDSFTFRPVYKVLASKRGTRHKQVRCAAEVLSQSQVSTAEPGTSETGVHVRGKTD